MDAAIDSNHRKNRKRIAVTIVIVVAGIAWCVHRAHKTAQAVTSASHLRELGAVLGRYADYNGGHFPDKLSDAVRYSPDPTLDIDPEWFVVPWGNCTLPRGKSNAEIADQIDAGGHCSYAYLGAGRTTADITDTSVLMYEAESPNPIGSIYCLFGDLHGESLTVPQAIDAIVKTPQPRATTQPAVPSTTSPAM